MKRIISVFLMLVFLIISISATACAQELSLSAQAYVLYCVENDTVLLSKNKDVKMKPASTTKIMTTLLTLEKCEKADPIVTFDESMIAEGSSMYLKLSDTVHLSDLAVGMMMCSGNDAANAAAISISSDTYKFSQLMNKRAQEIGMENTHFVTPSGLDDDNHYSTAYDLALLMSCALKNKAFADITKQKSMKVDFLTPRKEVSYNNHNRLLSLYEYCTGGKTGYTKSAGRCLVSSAQKDGLTLIAVTLNAPDDWNDHIAMYEYGFSKLMAVDTDDSNIQLSAHVVGSKKTSVIVGCDTCSVTAINSDTKGEIVRTVYLPRFLYAPINKGDFVGMITYTMNNEIIATNPLFALDYASRQE